MPLGEIFEGGGYMMWPLLLIGIGVVAVTTRAALRVRGGRGGEEVERGLISILFWGTMAAILGLLGTVIGTMQIGLAIQFHGAADSTTVWGGVTVALITLGFGLLIFVFALVCWYAVRGFSLRHRSVVG